MSCSAAGPFDGSLLRGADIPERQIISMNFDVIVIGGGPAGSSAAIALANGGMKVAILEKRVFPRDVLCGEFLSHEVIRAIRHFGLSDQFFSLRPNRITGFSFAANRTIPSVHPLGFEAWSLKRSLFDEMLLKKAEASGATIMQPAEVVSIFRRRNDFEAVCRRETGRFSLSATYVIAAYGRRDRLDRFLKRDFVSHRSGMHAVQYHLDRSAFTEFPGDDVRLYATEGVYCGINRVSEQQATVCFLTASGRQGHHPNDALSLLFQRNASFRELFRVNLPEVVRTLPPRGAGNIFFGRKEIIENGIFMVGDAAGVIAPLAGDGIAMAIESGHKLASLLLRARQHSLTREQTEELYKTQWRTAFRKRLLLASSLQRLAMKSLTGNLGTRFLSTFPRAAAEMARWTRS